MILGVDHAAITVSDMDRSLDFYCNKLGFSVSKVIDTPDLHIVFLRLGSSSVELFLPKRGPAIKKPSPLIHEVGLKHIALTVDDMEITYSELMDKGVTFSSAPQLASGGPKIAFFSDPDGVVIELIQWGEAVPE